MLVPDILPLSIFFQAWYCLEGEIIVKINLETDIFEALTKENDSKWIELFKEVIFYHNSG